MPSIQANSKGGMIRWDKDDWNAGLLPFAKNDTVTADQSSAYSIIEGKGFALSQAIDPLRNPGLISPGYVSTALTNSSTVTDAITGQCNYLTDAYLMGATGKIYHLGNGSTFDASAYGTITATAGNHNGHTGVATGDDIIYYKANVASVSTLCRFYSWHDDTDGDVGRIVTAFDNNFSDFMSTTPATFGTLSTSVHPMCVGNDDVLYIGNGNIVAGYDGANGANGTFTASKLVLPSDLTITSFQNLPNYLVIFASRTSTTTGSYASESIVFFWDMISADPTYKFNVDTFTITASFQYGSTVGCFGVGGSGGSYGGAGFIKMFMYDGTRFDLVKNFPICVAGTVNRNSVIVLDETIYFASFTGSFTGSTHSAVYAYGKELGDWKLNCIYSDGKSSGNFLDSFKNGEFVTLGQVCPIKLNTTYTTDARFVMPHVTPPLPSEQRARIKKIKVGYGNTCTGGRALTLYLNTNKGASQITIQNALTTVTSSTLTSNILKDSSGIDLGKNFFESIGLEGLYTTGSGATAAPLLEFVEVYYNTIKI